MAVGPPIHLIPHLSVSALVDRVRPEATGTAPARRTNSSCLWRSASCSAKYRRLGGVASGSAGNGVVRVRVKTPFSQSHAPWEVTAGEAPNARSDVSRNPKTNQVLATVGAFIRSDILQRRDHEVLADLQKGGPEARVVSFDHGGAHPVPLGNFRKRISFLKEASSKWWKRERKKNCSQCVIARSLSDDEAIP